MKSLFKKVYFKFCSRKPARRLKPQLAFRLRLRRQEYSVVLGKDKWSSEQSSRRWKRFKLEKVSIVFLPIRFLSFGAARKVFTKPVSFLPAIMGFYVIAYEEILGTVWSMHLAQK